MIKKFVNLHGSHTTFSIFDGFGYPEEHMRYSHKIGLDAVAMTEHGNLNSLSYAIEAWKKMRSEGKDIKLIFGVEAYFIPSLAKWRDDHAEAMITKKGLKGDADALPEDEAAMKKEIKGKLNGRSHLLLLAQSWQGLKNIYKLVSESHAEGNFYRYPRVDYKLLKKYNEGVIASSACLGGVLANDYWKNKDKGPEYVIRAMSETTREMTNIFGDRWYGEIQWNAIPEQHELNKFIIQVCQEMGVDVISTIDAHYPRPENWKDREVYKRLGWLGKSGTQKPEWMSEQLPKTMEETTYSLHPKNAEQMWESYKNYSRACGMEYDDDYIASTMEMTYSIAHDRIETFFPPDNIQLPDFVVPDGSTPEEELVKICRDKLREKGYYNNRQYTDRLISELRVIKQRGFSKYFLTMKAIADKANDIMLTGAGRGSAAGSLLAYLIDITQVDPIKYNLQFERFLTKDGSGYPDIDFDVAEPVPLKEILQKDWGRYSVVPISNYNTLQLRSLIKDISKLYDIPFAEVNAVTSKMLDEAIPKAKADHGIAAGVYTPTFEEVKKYSDSLKSFFKKNPDVEKHVDALYGMIRSASRHAGGILVADNLDQKLPLVCQGGAGNFQTPWAEGQHVRHLEPFGFIKFDVLGLASLRMIEEAVKHILQRHHGVAEPTHNDVGNYYKRYLHPDAIDLDDQKVWENVFHSGKKWAGVFQFTNSGAQDFCLNVKPTNIIELSAVTSIFRPGPLSVHADKEFMEVRNGERHVEYEHSILKDILEETNSIMIFQEQLSMIAHKMGDDISLDEGNKLRKMLTKKGLGPTVEEQKNKIYEKFVEGFIKKGLTSKQADEWWKKMEYFSQYSFSINHAICYSIISYQCAWLLTYYEAEWMAAFLDKEPEDRKEAAINVAKSCGFNIEPIHINFSGKKWEITPDGKTLIQPLSSIKGLGDAAMEQIILNRPFNTIEDLIFSEDIKHSKLNKGKLDVLIKSQAMNCLIDERFSNLKHLWFVLSGDKIKIPKTSAGLNKLDNHITAYADVDDFLEEEKVEFLASLTGMFPFHIIMKEHLVKQLQQHSIPPMGKFNPEFEIVWCVPRKVEVKTTKKGKPYYIIDVVDDTSSYNKIRCWGIYPEKDRIYINRPYAVRVDYDPTWGFSTRGEIKKRWKLLG